MLGGVDVDVGSVMLEEAVRLKKLLFVFLEEEAFDVFDDGLCGVVGGSVGWGVGQF